MHDLQIIQETPKARGRAGAHDAVVFIDEKAASNYYRQFAVHRMREAIGKYANAAKFIKDPRARSLLNCFARRKYDHALKLLGENGDAFQEIAKSRGASDSVSFTQYLLDVDLKPLSSLEETFLFILKNEQGTFSIYKKFTQDDCQTEISAFFNNLLRVQSGDIEFLRMEAARLNHVPELQQ
jgi:hypothetical protein